MTNRNQRYEAAQRQAGLKKVTLWVPACCETEIKLMAAHCCEHRKHIPAMARDLETGRLVKVD